MPNIITFTLTASNKQNTIKNADKIVKILLKFRYLSPKFQKTIYKNL